MLRAWGFLSCLSTSQNQLQDPTYKELFTSVTNAMIEVMKKNSEGTKTPAVTGGVINLNVGEAKEAKTADQAKKAGS
ncbi:hypothetical protein BV96_04700 [Sphingomonas paucimobilis]|nr:hypothetical protein BV96_04700 [Sphingomonas paucimobilis]